MKKSYLTKCSLGTKLIAGLVFMMLGTTAFAQTEIGSVRDLLGISEDLGGNYIQVRDIDLRDERNWTPIGSDERPFTGIYDGQGFKILNMTINNDGARVPIGFFGMISEEAVVRNLGIENANVVGSRPAAMLIGWAAGAARVIQCYASGYVRGAAGVGGLVGYVTEEAQILNSYATGQVVSTGDAGGLVGGNEGTITYCYAAAIVEGTDRNAGGLVGLRMEGGRVTVSFWDVQASGQEESNGGTGRSTAEMLQQDNYPRRDWNFTDIWGIVNGESYPFLLWQEEPGEHNYPAMGSPTNLTAVPGDRVVNLSWTEAPGDDWAGYNIYRGENVISSVEADVTTYQDRNLQNYTQYSYSVTAFLADETESRPSNTVLSTPHEPFAGGIGTEADPYEIETARNLSDIRFQPAAHFIQTANINLGVAPWNQGTGWSPIGYYVSSANNIGFTGSYNADGFVISNLTIIAPDVNNLGLFGYLEGATITGLTLEDAVILGRDKIGAIAAHTLGENNIINCYVSGEIEGRSGASGLISYFNGLMTNSHFNGTLTGTGQVGGLVAENRANSSINNCSVRGTITGTGQFVGGVVGQSYAEISETVFNGTLTGANSTGGIAGSSNNLTTRCAAFGSITSGSFYIGGIVGITNTGGNVTYCYADVDILGYRIVGGIVGSSGGNTITPAPIVSVTNSYARGTITATNPDMSQGFGGVVGASRGAITNCYAAVQMTGPAGQLSGVLHTRSAGIVSNSFWDTEVSRVNTSNGGGTPRMTRQMTYPYDGTTYVGWDFEDIWQDDEDGFGNNGYPMLFWQEIPQMIDSPQINVSIISEEGQDFSSVSWEAVAGARSYKVYATDSPAEENWGEPVRIVGEPGFQEAVEDAGRVRFYRVVASGQAPPEE